MNRQTVAFVLIFVFLISLFGCSKKIKPVSTAHGGFKCDFVMNIGKTEYKGNAKINNKSLADFTFSHPEEISGLTLKLENDNYTVGLGDITYEGAIDEFPNANPITGLYSVLFLNHNEEDLKSDSDGFYIEGKTSNGDYKTYYRADGFPQKIIFTEAEIEIEFSNISYLF